MPLLHLYYKPYANFIYTLISTLCFHAVVVIIVVFSHLHIPTVLPWFFAIFVISIFVFFYLFLYVLCLGVSLFCITCFLFISFLFTNSDTLQINTYDVRDGSIAVVTFHFTCLLAGMSDFFFVRYQLKSF